MCYRSLIISFVQYIYAAIHSPPTMIWIVFTIGFCSDLIAVFIAVTARTFELFVVFCLLWATSLLFQITYVACNWTEIDPFADVIIVLAWVKFALLFVVIFVLFIIRYRKRQRNNDTIRHSNVEPANVVTNVNDDLLPPRYEDLDQPPTYEESLKLQQQE